jgi:hypothetical protein
MDRRNPQEVTNMAIDPKGSDLEAFLANGPEGPVVMLNLLRFADGGRERYRQYARAFRETFAPRYGVEVIYAGDGAAALVAEDGQQWDAVLLVRYPSRRAFSRSPIRSTRRSRICAPAR